MKSIVTLFLSLMLLAGSAKAQSELVPQKMESLTTLWEGTSDMTKLQGAMIKMRKLSDEYSKEWLPAYWACYYYTQYGRTTTQKMTYYDTAQVLCNRMMESKKEAAPVEKSVLLTLQVLIYRLQMLGFQDAGNTTKVSELQSKYFETLNEAIKLDPANANLKVMTGVELMYQAINSKDKYKALAAKSLLEDAKRFYLENPRKSKTSPTHWGQAWVDVWISRFERI